MPRALTELERHLRKRREQRKLFIPYLTAGIPSPQRFVDVFSELAKIADAIEVGVPFSDPIMDGPVITEASSRALEGGMTLEATLQLIWECQRQAACPVVAMSYFNPIHHKGIDGFVRRAAEIDLSGLIVPDLPLESSEDLRRGLARKGIALIHLAAPNASEKRVREIAEASTGFVYAVSRLATTGAQSELGRGAGKLVESIRAVTDTPVLVGIGISGPEQAAEATRDAGADGVIVGSALVKPMMAGDVAEALRIAKEVRRVLDRGEA